MAKSNCTPKSFQNLAGQIFHYLFVDRRAENGQGWRVRWFCWCLLCGKETISSTRELRSGSKKSCGCLRRTFQKRATEAATKHGHSPKINPSGVYRSWKSMKGRCLNPNAANYKHYGGRGIQICERWLKFENFLEDMGERPEGTSLDRYPDTNGNYEKSNCRWATLTQQNCNMRRSRFITIGDETLNLSEWAQRSGNSAALIRQRIKKGMDPKEAIFNAAIDHKYPRI